MIFHFLESKRLLLKETETFLAIALEKEVKN